MRTVGRRVQAGFTLIETILVVVLLGTMMAGMTSLFVESSRRSHEPYIRQKAIAIADAFMDEIIHKSWDDNTPLGGGCVDTGSGGCPGGPVAAGLAIDEASRIDFDDIDDYNGIRNQTPPRDSADNSMATYDGYVVSVYVDQTGSWNSVPSADNKRIRIDVTSPTQETVTLTAYRVNE